MQGTYKKLAEAYKAVSSNFQTTQSQPYWGKKLIPTIWEDPVFWNKPFTTHNGRRYVHHAEQQNDGTWINHKIYLDDGSLMKIDWEPYSTPSSNDLKMWVSLGFPDRTKLKTDKPLNTKVLEKEYDIWFNTLNKDRNVHGLDLTF